MVASKMAKQETTPRVLGPIHRVLWNLEVKQDRVWVSGGGLRFWGFRVLGFLGVLGV